MSRPHQFGIIPFGAVGDIPKRRLVCIHLKVYWKYICIYRVRKRGQFWGLVSGWDHETDLYSLRDLLFDKGLTYGSWHFCGEVFGSDEHARIMGLVRSLHRLVDDVASSQFSLPQATDHKLMCHNHHTKIVKVTRQMNPSSSFDLYKPLGHIIARRKLTLTRQSDSKIANNSGFPLHFFLECQNQKER